VKRGYELLTYGGKNKYCEKRQFIKFPDRDKKQKAERKEKAGKKELRDKNISHDLLPINSLIPRFYPSISAPLSVQICTHTASAGTPTPTPTPTLTPLQRDSPKRQIMTYEEDIKSQQLRTTFYTVGTLW
jgi:hypothetical protein